MKKEKIVYLVSFLVLGTIAYTHSLGIFDPFRQLPTPAWIWITIGIALGLLLQKGLEL